MDTFNQDERRERIKALQRQEERTKKLPELLFALSTIAGRKISEAEVLTLEQIDQHTLDLNRSDLKLNYLNLSVPKRKAKELQQKIRVLSAELDQRNYLRLQQWKDLAVLQLNTSFVVDYFEELIDLDEDNFYIIDPGHQNGFWIDLYSDYWYAEGEAEQLQILELRVFGNEWIRKVASAL